MKEELQGNLVFDTGPLLELLNGSTLGAMVRERLEFEGPTPMTGEMNIAELRYLTCRKAGWRKSDENGGCLVEFRWSGSDAIFRVSRRHLAPTGA